MRGGSFEIRFACWLLVWESHFSVKIYRSRSVGSDHHQCCRICYDPKEQACLLGLSRGNKPVRSEQPEGTNQIRQFPPDPPERTRQFLSEGKAFIPWTERSDSLLRPNRRDKPAVTRTFSFSTRDIFNLANGGDGIIFFQTFSSYNFGSATQVGVGRGSGGFAQSGPGETPSCARRPREAVTRRRLFGGGPCIDCGDVSTRGT